MDPWDQHSPRACAPTPALLAHHSVCPATASLALSSPLPLALGLYLSRGGTDVARPLPLFYVPPSAAGALGLAPGWYAAAPPRGNLSVRVTRVREHIPGGDHMVARVVVDGTDANCPEAFHGDAAVGEERVVHGFVESYAAEDGRMDRVVRRFELGETVVGEGQGQGDVGCVRLEVSAGKAVRVERGSLEGGYVYGKGGKEVKEKAREKEGKSVSVGQGESLLIEGWTTEWEMNGGRVIGCVCVRLREGRWLKGRGVLDRDGVPYNGYAGGRGGDEADRWRKWVLAGAGRWEKAWTASPGWIAKKEDKEEARKSVVKKNAAIVHLDPEVIDLT